MNIDKFLWSAAKRRGLDWMTTGGGMDFIYKQLRDGSLVLFSDAADAGFSPDPEERLPVLLSFYKPGSFADGEMPVLTLTFPDWLSGLDALSALDSEAPSEEQLLTLEFNEFLSDRGYPALSAEDLLAERREGMKEWEVSYVLEYMNRWEALLT